jgi:hypothetical protein
VSLRNSHIVSVRVPQGPIAKTNNGVLPFNRVYRILDANFDYFGCVGMESPVIDATSPLKFALRYLQRIVGIARINRDLLLNAFERVTLRID